MDRFERGPSPLSTVHARRRPHGSPRPAHRFPERRRAPGELRHFAAAEDEAQADRGGGWRIQGKRRWICGQPPSGSPTRPEEAALFIRRPGGARRARGRQDPICGETLRKAASQLQVSFAVAECTLPRWWMNVGLVCAPIHFSQIRDVAHRDVKLGDALRQGLDLPTRFFPAVFFYAFIFRLDVHHAKKCLFHLPMLSKVTDACLPDGSLPRPFDAVA